MNSTHVTNTDNNNPAKKTWIKPQLEIISKDAIKGGVSPLYTEGTITMSGDPGLISS